MNKSQEKNGDAQYPWHQAILIKNSFGKILTERTISEGEKDIA